MQFCMHYAFENAAKARMMIENVSRYLRRGGIFIGTIPNAELLLQVFSFPPLLLIVPVKPTDAPMLTQFTSHTEKD